MCFGRVPCRSLEMYFVVLLQFTTVPVYYVVLFPMHVCFILCCIHLIYQFLGGYVMLDSWMRQSASMKSLICGAYRVTVDAVHSWYFLNMQMMLFILSVTVSLFTMNMNSFTNIQITLWIWTANCFDSSSYSKIQTLTPASFSLLSIIIHIVWKLFLTRK